MTAPAAPSLRTLQREAALAKAKEDAVIHRLSCRWRKQGVVCSMCSDTVERVARLLEGLP